MASRAQFISCQYCGKKCKTNKGLHQHQSQSQNCLQQAQAATRSRRVLPNQQPQQSARNQRSNGGLAPRVPETVEVLPDHGQVADAIMANETDHHSHSPMLTMQNDDDGPPPPCDSASATSATDSGPEFAAPPQYEALKNSQVSTEALTKFLEHSKYMDKEYFPFNKHDVQVIKLIDLLRNKRATLDTHQAAMEWHLKTNGTLMPHMGLGDYSHYSSV